MYRPKIVKFNANSIFIQLILHHNSTLQHPSILRPFTVRGLKVDFPVLLAPLAGITDYPFRKLAMGFGAGLCVTEMLASQAMVRKNRKSVLMTSSIHSERVLAQISGADPAVMADTARMLADQGAVGIDINMGCPQPKVVRTNAGAALMRDEPLAARIMEQVRKAVDVPVSVKMRLGWDASSMNALRLALMAQEIGIDFITIHARTRSQMFGGRAQWELIKPIKEALQIPVIANGDVTDIESAVNCLGVSGANGIMIGRAALGRPWIFAELKAYFETGTVGPALPISRQYDVIMTHIQDIFDFYGMPAALWMARKHLSWYSKGLRGGAAFRDRINRMENWTEIVKSVKSFYEGLEEIP